MGETVRRLRKTKRLSIDELAKQCELSPNYLGSIELGRRDISFSTLRVLAHFFGVKPCDVLAPPPHISQNAAHAVRIFEASTPAMRTAIIAILSEFFTASGDAPTLETLAAKSPAEGFGVAANWREEPPRSSETLGVLVRRMRKQQRLTIEKLAARTKLSPGHVANVERGNRDTGVLSICAIAEGLGITGRELLRGTRESISAECIAFGNMFDRASKDVQEALLVLLLARTNARIEEK